MQTSVCGSSLWSFRDAYQRSPPHCVEGKEEELQDKVIFRHKHLSGAVKAVVIPSSVSTLRAQDLSEVLCNCPKFWLCPISSPTAPAALHTQQAGSTLHQLLAPKPGELPCLIPSFCRTAARHHHCRGARSCAELAECELGWAGGETRGEPSGPLQGMQGPLGLEIGSTQISCVSQPVRKSLSTTEGKMDLMDSTK